MWTSRSQFPALTICTGAGCGYRRDRYTIICAVGPIGGRAHSPEEYLEVASIVPRAQALALAIMRLDAG
jgi:acetylornithine deacetylase/succinyl-diaminopimelate desuccinylase-like protein